MHTRKPFVAAILVSSLLLGCNQPVDAKNIDELWGRMTSEQRLSHLESRYPEALMAMESAADQEQWDAAYQDAKSVLSLMRAEMFPVRKSDYLAREAEFESFAQRTYDASTK